MKEWEGESQNSRHSPQRTARAPRALPSKTQSPSYAHSLSQHWEDPITPHTAERHPPPLPSLFSLTGSSLASSSSPLPDLGKDEPSWQKVIHPGAQSRMGHFGLNARYGVGLAFQNPGNSISQGSGAQERDHPGIPRKPGQWDGVGLEPRASILGPPRKTLLTPSRPPPTVQVSRDLMLG